MRFFGNYSGKVDAKGRAFLPAAFRKVLEAEDVRRLVLRPDTTQKCLAIYPESVWQQLEDELKQKLDMWNPLHVDLHRRFVNGGEMFELDANGRFLITKKKKERAGIRQDIVFLAVNDRIEVWDKDEYDRHFNDDADLGELIMKAMAESRQ
jgi:MraZ protein